MTTPSPACTCSRLAKTIPPKALNTGPNVTRTGPDHHDIECPKWQAETGATARVGVVAVASHVFSTLVSAFEAEESVENARLLNGYIQEHWEKLGIPIEIVSLIQEHEGLGSVMLARSILRRLDARSQLTGSERRLLHLIMDIEDAQYERVDDLYERNSFENRLKSLAERGLITVRATDRGHDLLDAHYDRKDREKKEAEEAARARARKEAP